MQQNAIGFSITVAVLALSPPRGSFLGVYYRSPVTLIYNMLMDEYISTSLLCLTDSSLAMWCTIKPQFRNQIQTNEEVRGRRLARRRIRFRCPGRPDGKGQKPRATSTLVLMQLRVNLWVGRVSYNTYFIYLGIL